MLVWLMDKMLKAFSTMNLQPGQRLESITLTELCLETIKY